MDAKITENQYQIWDCCLEQFLFLHINKQILKKSQESLKAPLNLRAM